MLLSASEHLSSSLSSSSSFSNSSSSLSAFSSSFELMGQAGAEIEQNATRVVYKAVREQEAVSDDREPIAAVLLNAVTSARLL